MKKIIPVGENILCLPLPKENHTTESGISIVDNTLSKAKVMEVSEEFAHIYKAGDIVIFTENAGIGQYYKQQQCLWLNPNGFPKGHIVGIVTEDK